MAKGEDRNKVVGKLAMKPDTTRWKDTPPPADKDGEEAGSKKAGGRRIVANCQAALLLIDGRLVVREVDLEGKVIVNGNAVTQGRLKEGDYLQLGDYELYVAETTLPGERSSKTTGSTAVLKGVKVIEAEEDARSASGERAAAAGAGLPPIPTLPAAPPRRGPETVADEDVPPARAPAPSLSGRGADTAAEADDGGVVYEEVEDDAFDVALSGSAPGIGEAAPGPKSLLDRIPPDKRKPLALVAGFLVVFFGVGLWLKHGQTPEEVPLTLGELLAPGLEAFEKNEFAEALTTFEKVKKACPESKLPKSLIDLARQFRDEKGDLSKFDWKGAQSKVKDIQACEGAEENIKKFSKEKLAWLEREEKCSGDVSEAIDNAEKGNFENALLLIEKVLAEHPQSDSLIFVQGELTKWRASVRNNYIAKAREFLSGQNPNWKEAIANFEKAQTFVKQEDPEIPAEIVRCQSNLKTQKELEEVLSLFEQAHYPDALERLERIKSGGFYDRAITNLRGQIVSEQTYRQAVQAYRIKDARRASDLLARCASDKKCSELMNKIRLVESGLEQGRRLLGTRDYREAMKAFQSVLSAEPDQANPYSRDASEGFKTCKARMAEQAVASYARGESSYKAERYGEALDEFQKALEYDEGGTLANRVKTRVLADAEKLFKEVHTHFITSNVTQSDYQALQILVNYLDKNHHVWGEAQKLLKGKPPK